MMKNAAQYAKFLAPLLMVVCVGCAASTTAAPMPAVIRQDTIMRTYNIGPLVQSLAMQNKAIRATGAQAWDFNPESVVQSTIEVIRNGVDPHSWAYVSGSIAQSNHNSAAYGRIDRIATLLVVTTTAENQAAVHRILEDMQRAAGPPRDRMEMRRRMMMRLREFMMRMRQMNGRNGMRGQGQMGPMGSVKGPMNRQPMPQGQQGMKGRMQPGMQGGPMRRGRPTTGPTTRPWSRDGRRDGRTPPPAQPATPSQN